MRGAKFSEAEVALAPAAGRRSGDRPYDIQGGRALYQGTESEAAGPGCLRGDRRHPTRTVFG